LFYVPVIRAFSISRDSSQNMCVTCSKIQIFHSVAHSDEIQQLDISGATPPWTYRPATYTWTGLVKAIIGK